MDIPSPRAQLMPEDDDEGKQIPLKLLFRRVGEGLEAGRRWGHKHAQAQAYSLEELGDEQ